MNVTTTCPTCSAVTTFEYRHIANEYGAVIQEGRMDAPRVVWMLMRCAGCGRAGLAELACGGSVKDGTLLSFHPRSADVAKLPEDVPKGIVNEFREAERCAAAETWRAASAMFRSALEKTLSANGYANGSLKARIDEAAADGVITAARAKRAHDNIRVLGNDVLHEDWHPVTEDEVLDTHRYTQRILEDFYDHRAEVEIVLRGKGRLP